MSKVIYSTIPGVEKSVSRIFFGTAIKPMLAGENVNELLDAVYEKGINAFDCARGYGLAEVSLGQWIKDRGNREKVVVLTKCGDLINGVVKVNADVIRREMEQSLKNLCTDYADIYLLHRYDPNTPMGEFVETLNDAKRQGMVKCFGVSNWTVEKITEFNTYAAEHGLDGISVSSPNFGLARQINDPWGGGCVTVSGPENKAAREWYAANNMPILAYSSLGRGFFSGKFKAFDYEAARTVLDEPAQKGYLYEENMKRLHNAEIIAQRDGCSVSQVVLRYISGVPMNVFALVSTTNPQRLDGNIDAISQPLNAEDIAFLENDQ